MIFNESSFGISPSPLGASGLFRFWVCLFPLPSLASVFPFLALGDQYTLYGTHFSTSSLFFSSANLLSLYKVEAIASSLPHPQLARSGFRSPVLSLNSVSLPQSSWAQQNHLEGLLKHKSCNFTPRISVSEGLGGGQDFAFLQVPSCYLSREQTFSPIAID